MTGYDKETLLAGRSCSKHRYVVKQSILGLVKKFLRWAFGSPVLFQKRY